MRPLRYGRKITSNTTTTTTSTATYISMTDTIADTAVTYFLRRGCHRACGSCLFVARA